MRLDPGDAAETANNARSLPDVGDRLGGPTCKAVEAQGSLAGLMQIALEWDSPADARGFNQDRDFGPLPKGVYRPRRLY